MLNKGINYDDACGKVSEEQGQSRMLKKLFVDHPQSVGESYFEHMSVAFGFGFKMLGAGFACMIHGLVPGLFKSTGSQAITCLHDKLVANRCRHNEASTHIVTTKETALG
jgi:Family of unknown function (DUF6356)